MKKPCFFKFRKETLTERVRGGGAKKVERVIKQIVGEESPSLKVCPCCDEIFFSLMLANLHVMCRVTSMHYVNYDDGEQLCCCCCCCCCCCYQYHSKPCVVGNSRTGSCCSCFILVLCHILASFMLACLVLGWDGCGCWWFGAAAGRFLLRNCLSKGKETPASQQPPPPPPSEASTPSEHQSCELVVYGCNKACCD